MASCTRPENALVGGGTSGGTRIQKRCSRIESSHTPRSTLVSLFMRASGGGQDRRRSTPSIARRDLESIADVAQCFDVRGLLRIGFDLTAQGIDAAVYAPGGGQQIIAPDNVDDGIACQGASGAAGE